MTDPASRAKFLEYLSDTIEAAGFFKKLDVIEKIKEYTKDKNNKKKNAISEGLEAIYSSKKVYVYCRLLQDYFAFTTKENETIQEQQLWKSFTHIPQFIMTKEFLKQLSNVKDESKVEIFSSLLFVLGLKDPSTAARNIDYRTSSIGPFNYSSYAYTSGFLVQRNLIQRQFGVHSPRNEKLNFRVSYQWDHIPIRFVSIISDYSENRIRTEIKRDSKDLFNKALKKQNQIEEFVRNELKSRLIGVEAEEKDEILSNILRKNENGLPGLKSKFAPKDKDDDKKEKEEKFDDLKEIELEIESYSPLPDYSKPDEKKAKAKLLLIPQYFSSDGHSAKGIPAHFETEFISIIAPAPEVCSLYNMAFMYRSYQDNDLYSATILQKLDDIEEKFNRSLVSNGREKSVLSPQEIEILNLPSNVLLLGRSGTGKTTCALLRLYAQSSIKYSESFMDLRQSNDSSNNNTLFISLSPVLTTQAKKFYRKFMEEKDTISQAKNNNIQDDDEEEAPLTLEEQEEELDTLPNSLSEITPDDSPTFVTFRRFLYMLDATLDQPFFARDKKKNLLGADKSSTWHGEGGGMMKIVSRTYVAIDENADDLMGDDSDGDIEDFFSDDEDIQQIKEARGEFKIVEQSKSSYEVDYNIFCSMLGQCISGCHPSLVWTEIQSYIKGSVESLLSPNGYLTLDQYLHLGRNRSLISIPQREAIYKFFLLYEKKKTGYDMQDLVYHIYSRIKHEGYRGVLMRNVFVDEVQDFTQAALQLIMEVCPYQSGFFLTGDTCQTIARGVGFRFSELKTLFHYRKSSASLFSDFFTVPSVQQLTYNFRSHRRLIDLGTSVVKLLEYLFPTSIDVLATDQSKIDGPMPMVMNFTTEEELFQFLFGNSKNKQEIDMQFGAQQVVIVRDQESKKKLPSILQHALCMTVYEAKGLEFEDVILFNFFTDSPCTHEWRIVNNFENVNAIAEFFENKSESGVVQLDFLNLQQDVKDLLESSQSGKKRYLQQVTFDHSTHTLLCSELKHLYVAVTRAKKNLYIFDQDIEMIFPMLRFWRSSGLIDIVKLRESEQMGIAAKTTPEEWRKQGINMLRNSYFAQAKHCFKNSGSEELYQRADAFDKANEASLLLKKINHPTVWTFEGQGVDPWLNPTNELLKEEKKAFAMFLEAAKVFEAIGCQKYAARCYSSTKEYLVAADLYLKSGQFRDAALNFIDAEEYEKAADCWREIGQVENAIVAYEKVDCYPKIIEFIAARNKPEERKYIHLYFKKALQVLVTNPVNPLDLQGQIEYTRTHLLPDLQFEYSDLVNDQAVLIKVIEEFDALELFDLSSRILMESNIENGLKSSMLHQKIFNSVVSLSNQYSATPPEKKNRRKIILDQIFSIVKYLNDPQEVKNLLFPLGLFREAASFIENYDLRDAIKTHEQNYSYIRVIPLYKELIAANKDNVESVKLKIDMINCYVRRLLQLTFDLTNGFPSKSNWNKNPNIAKYFEEINLLSDSTDIHQYIFLNPETPTITAVKLLNAIRGGNDEAVLQTSLAFSPYSHYRLIAYTHMKEKVQGHTIEPLVIILAYFKCITSIQSVNSLLTKDLRQQTQLLGEIYQLFQIEFPSFDSPSFNCVVLPSNHPIVNSSPDEFSAYDKNAQYVSISLGKLHKIIVSNLLQLIIAEFSICWKSKSPNINQLLSLYMQNYSLLKRYSNHLSDLKLFQNLRLKFGKSAAFQSRAEEDNLSNNSLLFYFLSTTHQSSAAEEIFNDLIALDKEIIWTETYKKLGNQQSGKWAQIQHQNIFRKLIDSGDVIAAGDYFFDHCTQYIDCTKQIVAISLAAYTIQKKKDIILPAYEFDDHLYPEAIAKIHIPEDPDILIGFIYDLFQFLVKNLEEPSVNHAIYFLMALQISINTPIPDYEYDEQYLIILEKYVNTSNFDYSCVDYCSILSGDGGNKPGLIEALSDDYDNEIISHSFSLTETNNNFQPFQDILPIERASRIISSMIITKSIKKLLRRNKNFVNELNAHSRDNTFDNFVTFYHLVLLSKNLTSPQTDRRLFTFTKSLTLLHSILSLCHRVIATQLTLSKDKIEKFYRYLCIGNDLKKRIWDDLKSGILMDDVTFASLYSNITTLQSSILHLVEEVEATSKNNVAFVNLEVKRQRELLKAKMKRRGKKKQSKLQRKKDWIKNR